MNCKLSKQLCIRLLSEKGIAIVLVLTIYYHERVKYFNGVDFYLFIS